MIQSTSRSFLGAQIMAIATIPKIAPLAPRATLWSGSSSPTSPRMSATCSSVSVGSSSRSISTTSSRVGTRSVGSMMSCSTPQAIAPTATYSSVNRHQPSFPSTMIPNPHRKIRFPIRCTQPACRKQLVTHCSGWTPSPNQSDQSCLSAERAISPSGSAMPNPTCAAMFTTASAMVANGKW